MPLGLLVYNPSEALSHNALYCDQCSTFKILRLVPSYCIEPFQCQTLDGQYCHSVFSVSISILMLNKLLLLKTPRDSPVYICIKPSIAIRTAENPPSITSITVKC